MYTYLTDIAKKIEDGKDIKECGIIVKDYLEIAEKENAIRGDDKNYAGIANTCIIENGEYFYIDFVLLEILTAIGLLRAYTNIKPIKIDDVEKWGVAEYDLIKKYKIDHFVKMTIPQKEYELFIDLLNKTIEDKITYLNSYQRILNANISKILKKIPSERKLKNILKKIEGFDKDKLKTITDLFNYSTKTKK